MRLNTFYLGMRPLEEESCNVLQSFQCIKWGFKRGLHYGARHVINKESLGDVGLCRCDAELIDMVF